jgi:hypothetical protein
LVTALGVRRQQHRLGHPGLEMKCKKDPHIRVNMCWEIGNEKKCVTLSKNDALATRNWVEEQGGVIFWFQALPD